MKLVIDMPEDLYKEKIRGTTSNRQDRKILECVKNGTPLEEELEKIRGEFYKCRDYIICNHNHTEADMNKLDGLVLAIAITDERISELKGENNATK